MTLRLEIGPLPAVHLAAATVASRFSAALLQASGVFSAPVVAVWMLWLAVG